MNMRKIVFFVIAMLSAPPISFAEVKCTDRPECWPEGSAMRTGLLRRQIENELRKQLEQTHKELVSLISTKEIIDGVEYFEDQRLVEAVEAQQKSWDQFKNRECELIGALSPGPMSAWQTAKAVECEVNLSNQRLKRMVHAIGCVKRVAPVDRKSCLYQLAPLAVPLEK